MLNWFRRKPPEPEPQPEPKPQLDAAPVLVERLSAEGQRGRPYDIRASALGRQLLAASPREQREFVLAATAWLRQHWGPPFDTKALPVYSALQALLWRKLPFEHDDLIALLEWSIVQTYDHCRCTPQMIRATEGYLKRHSLTPALQERIGRLAEAVKRGYSPRQVRKDFARLEELAGLSSPAPLVAGEAWADAALAEIAAMDPERRTAWLALLGACAQARGAAPTAKWLKLAGPLLAAVGPQAFREAVLRWFPLVDEPRTQCIDSWQQWEPDPNLLLQEENADILKALAWLCAGREDREIARALTRLAISAYRKVPLKGPRCPRLGNACIWTLSQLPGDDGVAQLAFLRARVKINAVQKGIDAALADAAGRVGLAPEELEELGVPSFGLQEVGVRRERIGDWTAELTVAGTSSVEVAWARPNGKMLASAPQAVRREHAAEYKELAGAAKDICQMLAAQRDRIERLYLAERGWRLEAWRERYLDHPLVGTLARRLIWKFSRGDRAASGIWHEGRIVGRDGRPLEWLDAATRVELWHPLQVDPEAVLEWRGWLAQHEVQQPFKQAHREVYLLTDAERRTRVYSNRFAAHIVKQHQFSALCAARGWAHKLQLMVDDTYPPPARLLPRRGLRAEFWVESVGGDYGTATNQAGTYLYLSTDQVRFYAQDAPENRVHASGGGYDAAGGGRRRPAEPMPLDQVPALVFSEIMRDVDLFVGVASVGNDPAWSDGGLQGRYRDYWARYAFGDLSETARTRRLVLEGLIPRLKIADRCRLEERFLVVRGDLRTYKIHLGSGNILMEPGNRYLCIVRGQGAAGEGALGRIFLPFEGDGTLSLILSKAFLLAADREIKDPTIVQQIR